MKEEIISGRKTAIKKRQNNHMLIALITQKNYKIKEETVAERVGALH